MDISLMINNLVGERQLLESEHYRVKALPCPTKENIKYLIDSDEKIKVLKKHIAELVLLNNKNIEPFNADRPDLKQLAVIEKEKFESRLKEKKRERHLEIVRKYQGSKKRINMLLDVKDYKNIATTAFNERTSLTALFLKCYYFYVKNNVEDLC